MDERGNESRFRVGHFFQAIKIDSFVDLEIFKKNIGSLLRDLRSVKKLPGKSRVYTAGEKEYENQKRVEKEGVLIDKNLFADLQYIEQLLNINMF